MRQLSPYNGTKLFQMRLKTISAQHYSRRPRQGHGLNDHGQTDKEGVMGLPGRSGGRPATQGTRFVSLVQELRSHRLWSNPARAPPFRKPGNLQRLLRHEEPPVAASRGLPAQQQRPSATKTKDNFQPEGSQLRTSSPDRHP